MSVEFRNEGHLGGYIVGGDPATYYPELWEWLVREQGVRSVLDVGCGEGHAVDFFTDRDCDAVGLDGVAQDNPRIFQHDFATGPVPTLGFKRRFDLGWSCEFVEHVEERYVSNFLDAFARCDLVLMTHAEPGQLGHHHVNCQFATYWVGAMAAIGYRWDEDLTYLTRAIASRNESEHNHYLRSGLAFRRYAT